MSMEPVEEEEEVAVVAVVAVVVVVHNRMANTLGHRMESTVRGTSLAPGQLGEELVVS